MILSVTWLPGLVLSLALLGILLGHVPVGRWP